MPGADFVPLIHTTSRVMRFNPVFATVPRYGIPASTSGRRA